MTQETPPVSEDELHAYVDGQLPPDRRQALETYLQQDAEAAALVADYQAQRAAIRLAFAAQTVGPPPTSLSLAHIMAERHRRPAARWQIASSIVLALGLGAGAGWVLHDATRAGEAQQAITLLEQEALTSHVVYSVDVRHPVEVPATETPHLQQWLSNRLERTVVAPDLSTLGYHLVGGRLLATELGGAAALLMYDDTKRHRISVLLRPMTPALRAPGELIQRGGVNGRAWIANGLGIAVISTLPETDIATLAAQIGADLKAPS